MTIDLNPGCFASILASQPESETCQKCPVHGACFEAAFERQETVLALVAVKLEARGEDTLARVQRYVRGRCYTGTVEAKSGNARSDKLLQRFQSERINLEAFKSRENPFRDHPNRAFYWMADFILKGVPFKPKDMTEHVQAHCDTGTTTGSLKSEVARFASAMVSAGILERKEAYILCLAV
jgi:hypothetical protein